MQYCLINREDKSPLYFFFINLKLNKMHDSKEIIEFGNRVIKLSRIKIKELKEEIERLKKIIAETKK